MAHIDSLLRPYSYDDEFLKRAEAVASRRRRFGSTTDIGYLNVSHTSDCFVCRPVLRIKGHYGSSHAPILGTKSGKKRKRMGNGMGCAHFCRFRWGHA